MGECKRKCPLKWTVVYDHGNTDATWKTEACVLFTKVDKWGRKKTRVMMKHMCPL